MQHNILYEHSKFLEESIPKFCRFKINSFDNMTKLYRDSGLVYEKQKSEGNVKMCIFNTNYNYI